MMKTNRSWVKLWLLSIITLGIYGIWYWTTYGEDLNLLAPQRKKTMNYCLVFFIFSWLTLGIVPIVWQHRVSAKIGNILRERGINYNVSAADYWLWGVLGSLIIVGPFIYYHKMSKAMNLAAGDYNNRIAAQNAYFANGAR